MRRNIASIALVALLASACASGKDTGFPPPSPTPTGSPTAEPTGPVELTGPIDVALGNLFLPKIAKVKAGTTVVWKQSDTAAPHTVTADDGSFDSHLDCSFQAGAKCLTAGQEFSRTFIEVGEFPYYCKLHGDRGGAGMAGTIIVEA